MASCLWNHRLTAVCALLVVCSFASSVHGQATAPSVIIRTTVETCKRGISPGSVVCDRRIATNANVESVLLDGYRESSAVVTNNGETMRATTHARNDIAVARGPAFWDEVSGTVTVEVYLKYTGAETEIYQVYVDQIYRHTESTGTHLSANAEATTSPLTQDSLGLPQVGPNNFFQEGTAGSFRGGLVTLPEYPGIQYKGTIYQGLAANVRHTIALNDGVDERMFGLVDWVVEVKARLKVNPPPVAVIKGPIKARNGELVSKVYRGLAYNFDETMSYDPDDSNIISGFRWVLTKPDGSQLPLSPNARLFGYVIDQIGIYKLLLTVTDNENNSGTKEISFDSEDLKPLYVDLLGYSEDLPNHHPKEEGEFKGDLVVEVHIKSNSDDYEDLTEAGLRFDETIKVINFTNEPCLFNGFVKLPPPWSKCVPKMDQVACWGKGFDFDGLGDSGREYGRCGNIKKISKNRARFLDRHYWDTSVMFPLKAGTMASIIREQRYKYSFDKTPATGELNQVFTITRNIDCDTSINRFYYYTKKNDVRSPYIKDLGSK